MLKSKRENWKEERKKKKSINEEWQTVIRAIMYMYRCNILRLKIKEIARKKKKIIVKMEAYS